MSESEQDEIRSRPSTRAITPDVPPRRRRDDGPALARVGPRLGRRGRWPAACRAPCPKRFAALFMGYGVNPTTGGPRARARRWSWASASSRWRRSKAKLNVVSGLFNKHATGVGIHPGPDRQHPLGRGTSEGGRAQGGHQHRPGARQAPGRGDRRSRAWSWAASSRSPATTRRTSRWRTARTSPGRARPRRCRWRSIRRWPSTAFSTTRAASGTRASSTASSEEAAGPEPAGQPGRPGQARRVPDERPRGREAGRPRCEPRRTRPTTAPATAAGPPSTMPRPDNGLPEDIREHMRLMCDIIALAFQTDKTRVATLLLCRDISGPLLPVPRRPRGAPPGLARRPVRRLRAGHALLRAASSPTSPAASTRCPRARARCSTTRACCSSRACGRAAGTTSSKVPVVLAGGLGGTLADRPRPRLHRQGRRQPQALQPVPRRSWTAWA